VYFIRKKLLNKYSTPKIATSFTNIHTSVDTLQNTLHITLCISREPRHCVCIYGFAFTKCKQPTRIIFIQGHETTMPVTWANVSNQLISINIPICCALTIASLLWIIWCDFTTVALGLTIILSLYYSIAACDLSLLNLCFSFISVGFYRQYLKSFRNVYNWVSQIKVL
jgi:hypothetical protein